MFCKITGKHKRAQGPTQTHLTYVERAKGAISALSSKKNKNTCKINYQFLFEPLDLTDVAYRLSHITCSYDSPKSTYFSHGKNKEVDCCFSCHQNNQNLVCFHSIFPSCILHWLVAHFRRYTLKLPFLENFQFAIKQGAAVVFTSKFSDTDTCKTFPLYYSSKEEERILLAG